MVQELIRNILAYVMVITILQNMVSHPGCLPYLRLAGGMILILILMGPILQLCHLDSDWFSELEKNIFQVDQQQIQEEMKQADGDFSDVLLEESQTQIEEQIQKLLEQESIGIRSVKVTLDKEQQIKNIKVCLDGKSNEKKKQEQQIQKVIMEQYQIEAEKITVT